MKRIELSYDSPITINGVTIRLMDIDHISGCVGLIVYDESDNRKTDENRSREAPHGYWICSDGTKIPKKKPDLEDEAPSSSPRPYRRRYAKYAKYKYDI